MKGWYGDKYKHSLSSRGIKNKVISRNFSKGEYNKNKEFYRAIVVPNDLDCSEINNMSPVKVDYIELTDEDGDLIVTRDIEDEYYSLENGSDTVLCFSKTFGGAVIGAVDNWIFRMGETDGYRITDLQRENNKLCIFKTNKIPDIEIVSDDIADFPVLEEVRYRDDCIVNYVGDFKLDSGMYTNIYWAYDLFQPMQIKNDKFRNRLTEVRENLNNNYEKILDLGGKI